MSKPTCMDGHQHAGEPGQHPENQQDVNNPGSERSTPNQQVAEAQSRIAEFLNQLELVQSMPDAAHNPRLPDACNQEDCNLSIPDSLPELVEDYSDYSAHAHDPVPPLVESSDTSSLSTHDSMPPLEDLDDTLSIPDSLPDLIDERELDTCHTRWYTYRNSDELIPDNLSLPDSLPDLVPGSECGDYDYDGLFVTVDVGDIQTDYWDTFSLADDSCEEVTWSDSEDSVLSDLSDSD